MDLEMGMLISDYIILVVIFAVFRWSPEITIVISLILVIAAATNEILTLAAGEEWLMIEDTERLVTVVLDVTEKSLTNQMSIYACGFLSSGVALFLVQYIRNSIGR